MAVEEKKQYRLGIIGYGGMAKWHHDNLDRVEEVIPYSAYDIDEERLALAKEEGLKIYDSMHDLLEDDAVDIVLVACPNNFHAEFSIEAMRKGKHVICEKPVTMNSMELERIMEVQKETGMHFSVHQNRRWDSDYLTVKKVLAEGGIGKPYRIVSKVLGSRGIPEGWRAHQLAGGGMMLDWGVHLIDQVCQLIDEEIVQVDAKMYHTHYTEVDDGFCATFTFASGLQAVVEVDTNAFIQEPRWIVRGTSGSLIVKNWEVEGEIIEAKDQETVWEDEILYTSAGPTKTMAPRTRFTEKRSPLPVQKADWIDFYRNFIATIEGREEALVKLGENLLVMRLMEACFQSSMEKRSISFDMEA